MEIKYIREFDGEQIKVVSYCLSPIFMLDFPSNNRLLSFENMFVINPSINHKQTSIANDVKCLRVYKRVPE